MSPRAVFTFMATRLGSKLFKRGMSRASRPERQGRCEDDHAAHPRHGGEPGSVGRIRASRLREEGFSRRFRILAPDELLLRQGSVERAPPPPPGESPERDGSRGQAQATLLPVQVEVEKRTREHGDDKPARQRALHDAPVVRGAGKGARGEDENVEPQDPQKRKKRPEPGMDVQSQFTQHLPRNARKTRSVKVATTLAVLTRSSGPAHSPAACAQRRAPGTEAGTQPPGP